MTMHFADTGPDNKSKASKVAVVGLIHVVLGYGLIQSINGAGHVELPKIMETMVELVPPKIVPPPPEPPKATPKTVTPPKALVPPPEVVVEPQVEPEQTIQADVMQDVVPPPAVASSQGEAAPSTDSSATGTMRTAVFSEGCATPEYPARAARNGESGTVRLALLVGADGRVTSSRVSQSSGSRDLDKAAVQALSLCKFQPAVNNGQAEAGWAQIDYVWKLEG
ncbi:MAG TPA: TonB family protein [Telluria sp.]|nr:TonB family protein [Telluria sp.]